MKHKKFKVKVGLVGSSDYRRVKSSRAILEANHKKHVLFFDSIKSVEGDSITTEKDILSKYSKVYVFGKEQPVSKYIGVLLFMKQNDFKFSV